MSQKMKSALLPLFLLTVSTQSSMAQVSARYETFGRGMTGDYGDTIALTCLNDTCTQAVFMEFKSDGTVTRIGDIIPVPQLSDPKEFKKAFNLTLQCYFGLRIKERFGDQYPLVRWGTFIFAGIVVAATVTPATWPLVAHYGVGLVSGASLRGVFTQVIWRDGKNREFFRIIRTHPATYDQGGWNWVETPVELRSKRYLELRDAITADPDWGIAQKNNQLMKKLSKKFGKFAQEQPLFTNAILGFGASLDACGLEKRIQSDLPKWNCRFESGGGIHAYAMTEQEARALCEEDLKRDRSATVISQVTLSTD